MVLLMLLVLIALNGMLIYHYYDIFTPENKFYWPLFVRNFHVSGFDPITYYVVSRWDAMYNVYRHPLLAFYMYVPYLVNQGLMWLTGINCALFVVAAIQIFCATYSLVFFYRILREVLSLQRADATLLSLFFFSFAYVMLSAIVPDHFIISMMLLLLALYVSGKLMLKRRPLTVWQTALYFLLTAGTSLNNGLKVFFSALFVNKRRFFRLRYLLLGVLFPTVLIWGFSKWEYKTLVWPQETARHAKKAKMKAAKEKKEKERKLAQWRADSMAIAHGDTARKVAVAKKEAPRKKRIRQGRPLSNGEFMRWTDITTSRWETVKENLLGESIQLHPDYLLQDVMTKRPMFVHYGSIHNYLVEGLIILLFLVGAWCGRRSRFFWLVMSYFGLDMALHLGLGFGMNEVYIMSAHWIYAIPIAIGFLLVRLQRRWQPVLRGLLGLLTVYLWAWNVWLIGSYLL